MPDGVWLVELAPVADPADLISAVLSVLGLREQALLYAGKPLAARLPPGHAAAPDEQADALGRLLTTLAAQRTLLVLDNCEHLIEAAATLADRILAACPQVRVLVTSREPLNITGEALWTVGPLTLPPDPAVSSDIPERTGPLAPKPTEPSPGIDAYAAVSLLVQRARAVFPEFGLTKANAPAVARICRALDGMPLAVRPGADGTRYRMLEIIRAYGQERLTEVGEHDELRRAHARHFTQLAVTRLAARSSRLRMPPE
jgi:predicted ATPase